MKNTTNYRYSIPRQLIYSRPRIFIPSSTDSSTALAMDLPPLLAMAEWEESRVLLLTLLRVGVLAVLQHLFSFFLVGGQGFPPWSKHPTVQQPASFAWPWWQGRPLPTNGHADLRPPLGLPTWQSHDSLRLPHQHAESSSLVLVNWWNPKC